MARNFSKRSKAVREGLDPAAVHSVVDAVKMVKEGATAKFDETIEIAINLGVDHNVVDLTGESFTVDVLSGRADYLYSTKFLVGAWVQFNEATHEMITNLRLNFIHSPLRDLFLVYSEKRLTDASVVVDRRFTVKLTKLFAF